MLHEIQGDGYISHKCVMCGNMNNTHISDTSIQYVDHASVSIPSCSNCGATCTVKAQYAQDELEAPNMRVYEIVMVEQMVEHPVTKEQVMGKVPEKQDVGPNPSISKHQELARQLEAIGKVPLQ